MRAAETAQTEESSDRSTAIRIFRTYLAPHWRTLATALACAVIVALFTAFLAWLLNPAIKRIFIQKRTDSLILIPVLIIGAGLVRAVFQIC